MPLRKRKPTEQAKLDADIKVILDSRKLLESEPGPRPSVLSGKSPIDISVVPQLNWLHVETLLNQASDLMDRAVNTRQALRNAKESWFLQTQQAAEFEELDSILRREEAADVLGLPSKAAERGMSHQANVEREAKAVANYHTHVQEKFLRRANDYETIKTATKYLARLTGRHMYSTQSRDPRPPKKVQSHQEWREYSTLTGFPDAWPAWRQAEKYSLMKLRYSSNLQRHILEIQKKQLEKAEEEARKLKDLFGEELALIRKKIEFDLERKDVARNYQEKKVAEASRPEGALNFQDRIRGLAQRYIVDFESAIYRLLHVSKGLKELFDYSVGFPSRSSFNTEGEYFDSVFAWCRQATQWVIFNSNSDQSMVHVISLRRHIGESKWRAGLSGGSWAFRLSEDDIPNSHFVRLRGISSYVRLDGRTSNLMYRTSLTPPKSGKVFRADGTYKRIDQNHLKRVTIGRVHTRDAMFESDVAGTVALFNASPLGSDWNVSCEGTSYSSDASLNDVEIELHIAHKS